MKNEPVAWMYKNDSDTFFSAIDHSVNNKWIPLYTHPVKEQEPTVPKNMQEWKGMDGATAYLLIDRHADNWADAKQMMEEWLEANSNLVNPYQSITDTKIEPTIVSYTHPAELTDEEIIESLAELEHEQWMKWADTIMQTEKISDARFARWASCMIPYADLTEEMKEFDREWARKALAILRKAQEK